MRGERGQATVEWIGTVLLVALALAALSQFAPKADGRELGRSVAHAVTGPAARPATRAALPAPLPSGRASPVSPRAVTVPPLVPPPRESTGGRRLRLPRARTVMRRARAGVGPAWRRAWIACLVYERFRYAFLHPESRFPGHTIPPSEVLRMVNDCISPLDLVRDWELVDGR